MSTTNGMDVGKLRSEAFIMLSSAQDLDSITYKTLRTYLEAKLELEPDSLKNYKDELMDIISDFRSSNKGRKRLHSAAASTIISDNNMDMLMPGDDSMVNPNINMTNPNPNLLHSLNANMNMSMPTAPQQQSIEKKKKYSNQESALIMKVVQEYLEVHNMTPQDICPALRDTPDTEEVVAKQKRISCSLWNELHQLISTRSVPSIYGHVQSKLFHSLNKKKAKWDKSEIDQLLAFVRTYGTQWSYIGRLMQRFPDDCKHVYYRNSVEKKRTGAYSADEDDRILVAIQKALDVTPVLQLTPQTTRQELVAAARALPEVDIPWEAVAVYMDKERLGIDYCRRWPKYRHKLLQSGDAHATASATMASMAAMNGNSSSSAAVAPVMQDTELLNERRVDLSILNELSYLDPEDESDVIWREIDRKCQVDVGKAKRRWKTLCKLYCANTTSFQECLQILMNKNREWTGAAPIPLTASSMGSMPVNMSIAPMNSGMSSHMVQNMQSVNAAGILGNVGVVNTVGEYIV